DGRARRARRAQLGRTAHLAVAHEPDDPCPPQIDASDVVANVGIARPMAEPLLPCLLVEAKQVLQEAVDGTGIDRDDGIARVLRVEHVASPQTPTGDRLRGQAHIRPDRSVWTWSAMLATLTTPISPDAHRRVSAATSAISRAP